MRDAEYVAREKGLRLKVHGIRFFPCAMSRASRAFFTNHEPRTTSHKQRVTFLAALILLLCGAAACGSPNARDQKGKNQPVPVKITKAVRADLTTSSNLTGTIAPLQESFFGPKISGRIEHFFVEEGSFVEKGSPLVRLEQTRLALVLHETKASLRESQANLRNLRQKLERQEKLFQTGVVDRQMHDDIKTQVELAEARVRMAESQQQRAEEDLKDSILYAPFSGFVVERRMNIGETYSTAADKGYIFHLVDTSSVEVEIHVFETKKRYLNTGEKVTVTVDAIPDKSFEGTITVVNPLVDAPSRKFLVKIRVANPSFLLESGMFARVTITEEKSPQALIVPASAVIERDGTPVVFIAANGAAVERQVKTGLVTREAVEVLAGVQDGESIITDGLYALKNGTPVVVQQ